MGRQSQQCQINDAVKLIGEEYRYYHNHFSVSSSALWTRNLLSFLYGWLCFFDKGSLYTIKINEHNVINEQIMFWHVVAARSWVTSWRKWKEKRKDFAAINHWWTFLIFWLLRIINCVMYSSYCLQLKNFLFVDHRQVQVGDWWKLNLTNELCGASLWSVREI